MKKDPPESFQIPMYVSLAQENGLSVEQAVYYDVSKAEFSTVYAADSSEGWLDEEEMRHLHQIMEKESRSMAERIVHGDYSTPAWEEGCDSCEYRRLCREKYFIRSVQGR
jgi:hypothetical protein